ncbi:uncharacterized protein E0L32_000232 [Thyridium curvatum]|uniref:Uncharacterized protein n=1 Tax=Thyridium curvatum TaxID=1093900 RepID=A0A507BGQ5_9PEZI|nr:uncharacterized protein E0L32_000232 [Thyridium curvatum]TPX15898.1 hypothetical protein E0L32_000232 [Thyridium curvatum]
MNVQPVTRSHRKLIQPVSKLPEPPQRQKAMQRDHVRVRDVPEPRRRRRAPARQEEVVPRRAREPQLDVHQPAQGVARDDQEEGVVAQLRRHQVDAGRDDGAAAALLGEHELRGEQVGLVRRVVGGDADARGEHGEPDDPGELSPGGGQGGAEQREGGGEGEGEEVDAQGARRPRLRRLDHLGMGLVEV